MKLLLNESLKSDVMQGHAMALEAARLNKLRNSEYYPMPELQLMKLQVEAEGTEARRKLLAFAAFCNQDAVDEMCGLELLLPDNFRLGLEPIAGQA
ncbi:MAG: hypothetical protein U0487_01940 [Patescibacteria group bacterium]